MTSRKAAPNLIFQLYIAPAQNFVKHNTVETHWLFCSVSIVKARFEEEVCEMKFLIPLVDLYAIQC